MINRAYSYMKQHSTRSEGPVDKLAGHIMSAWNPNEDGLPDLDFASPFPTIHSLIVNMPLDAVIKSSRDLYGDRELIQQIC
ncbi:hypothetical protein [Pseudomonas sp. CCC2.2]|uniref:hypothetical protein n=1 Tax=Pseudomonas sp. CCC2.2 TaxID=3048605 RepID=UPI002B223EA5|nr:hypothetical protein [Pseudomonas sp. CCC2.2]MEB0150628.1 hypothetical protein [Pseudomonas sp. CCC2.2]